jgi:hypothetical protein
MFFLGSIVISAAILGVIIAVMEQDEFPGWGNMVICVLAAIVPAAIINAILPPILFFVGLTVGAICAGFAISLTCGMTLKRACIAAGIYLGIQTALSVALYFMLR